MIQAHYKIFFFFFLVQFIVGSLNELVTELVLESKSYNNVIYMSKAEKVFSEFNLCRMFQHQVSKFLGVVECTLLRWNHITMHCQ